MRSSNLGLVKRISTYQMTVKAILMPDVSGKTLNKHVHSRCTPTNIIMISILRSTLTRYDSRLDEELTCQKQ